MWAPTFSKSLDHATRAGAQIHSLYYISYTKQWPCGLLASEFQEPTAFFSWPLLISNPDYGSNQWHTVLRYPNHKHMRCAILATAGVRPSDFRLVHKGLKEGGGGGGGGGASELKKMHQIAK